VITNASLSTIQSNLNLHSLSTVSRTRGHRARLDVGDTNTRAPQELTLLAYLQISQTEGLQLDCWTGLCLDYLASLGLPTGALLVLVAAYGRFAGLVAAYGRSAW
jgi:hypothetical protein